MDVRASSAYPVLLAGGSGSRLWPVSRQRFPKQLVKFIGDDSLVQSTVKRLCPFLDTAHLRIVCGEEHRFEIGRHIEQIGISAEGKIIAEPCGRNTAPAILLAVLMILKNRSDAVICVFPADHVIKDTERFHQNLAAAVELAGRGHIVTFGIQPHYPETGYGYIEGGDAVGRGALVTRRFVEKPDRRTAESYLAAGNFYWNSGMFAFSGATILEEFRRYQPRMLEVLEGVDLSASAPVPEEVYRRLPDISIDYAIMEKTAKCVVLPSDFGWSDIGSWKSLYEFLPKDDRANVIEGDVICRQTRDCFILGGERLIAANHLKGMVVVETPDSIFVSDMENSRDVKSIVDELKAENRQEYRHHRTVHLPWGSRTLLDQTPHCLVESLVVHPLPGGEVDLSDGGSVQVSIVKGRARVTVNGEKRTCGAGEVFAVAGGQSAAIRNDLQEDLHLIRVSVCEAE